MGGTNYQDSETEVKSAATVSKSELISKLKEGIRNREIDSYDIPETLDGASLKVEDEWGGEGQGDDCGFVLEVKLNNETFFVIANDYYSSYEGSDYSDASVFEVEPYMKQVRDWREIK